MLIGKKDSRYAVAEMIAAYPATKEIEVRYLFPGAPIRREPVGDWRLVDKSGFPTQSIFGYPCPLCGHSVEAAGSICETCQYEKELSR